ncbi:MAG: DUF4158 domain-containing protein [Anaerolineae bacterium]|nr:DUF4158 domain-containing protein [Anaerolineae bacterium]
MSEQERFLPHKKRYQSISLPEKFSDEEMARDWTLTDEDKEEIGRYRKHSRVLMAIQICAVRLYGRFLTDLHDLSPRIINYLNTQLELPPSLTIQVPHRETTQRERRKQILDYLGVFIDMAKNPTLRIQSLRVSKLTQTVSLLRRR